MTNSTGWLPLVIGIGLELFALRILLARRRSSLVLGTILVAVGGAFAYMGWPDEAQTNPLAIDQPANSDQVSTGSLIKDSATGLAPPHVASIDKDLNPEMRLVNRPEISGQAAATPESPFTKR